MKYYIKNQDFDHKYNIVVESPQEIEGKRFSIYPTQSEISIVSVVDNGNQLEVSFEKSVLEYYEAEALSILLRFATIFDKSNKFTENRWFAFSPSHYSIAFSF